MSAKKNDTKSSKKAPPKRSVKHTAQQTAKKDTSKYRPSTAWKPGQSGNPRGRPPVRNSLAETFRDYLDGRDKSGRIRKKKLADCLYSMATEDKSVAAARLLKDTVAGIELEDRLVALEDTVRTLVGATKYGSH